MEAGFERIRINAVVLRGRNEQEVPDLVRFALTNQFQCVRVKHRDSIVTVIGHVKIASIR